MSAAATPGTRWLYVTVFVSGMCALAVELTAARLLGSVFGASNLVWANIIGLMLLYLSAGYWLGGRLADRSPHARTLYHIVLRAALLCALMPLLARPVLQLAAGAVANIEAGVALGAFLAVLLLFAAPVTLLGCVSPFALRLLVTELRVSGRETGRVLAISTLGSLLGTFLPVLLFIPALGTVHTFLAFAGLLWLTAWVGLWQTQRRPALRMLWMPLLITLLTLALNRGPLRAAPPGMTLLEERESAYNYIQVLEDGNGMRYLQLNEGQGIHSQWHPEQVSFGRTWSFFLTAPWFNEPPHAPQDVRSLAIVGLAAGTIARQHQAVYGDIPIDGIEIDPQIPGVGRRWFGMDLLPGLNTIVDDGRVALNRLSRRYSLVALDAYRPPYIPWHLTTREFFSEARKRLREDGVLAVNVGRTPGDRRLVAALTATLRQVFPSVHSMDVPHSFNTLLVATLRPTTSDNLARNLAALPSGSSPILREALALGARSLVPNEWEGPVLTDDMAPVERIVDALVLDFLLHGDLGQLAPAS